MARITGQGSTKQRQLLIVIRPGHTYTKDGQTSIGCDVQLWQGDLTDADIKAGKGDRQPSLATQTYQPTDKNTKEPLVDENGKPVIRTSYDVMYRDYQVDMLRAQGRSYVDKKTGIELIGVTADIGPVATGPERKDGTKSHLWGVLVQKNLDAIYRDPRNQKDVERRQKSMENAVIWNTKHQMGPPNFKVNGTTLAAQAKVTAAVRKESEKSDRNILKYGIATTLEELDALERQRLEQERKNAAKQAPQAPAQYGPVPQAPVQPPVQTPGMSPAPGTPVSQPVTPELAKQIMGIPDVPAAQTQQPATGFEPGAQHLQTQPGVPEIDGRPLTGEEAVNAWNQRQQQLQDEAERFAQGMTGAAPDGEEYEGDGYGDLDIG